MIRAGAALALWLWAAAALGQQIDGVLEPADYAELRASLPATIRAIPVREGARVAAGDLLIELDAAVPEARVALARVAASSEGQAARAAALVAQAEALLARIERAQSSGAAKPWEVEQARQAVQIARADRHIVADQRRQAAAQLALEQATLGNYRLAAPFDGRVLQIHSEAGELATPQDVLLEIGHLARLEATIFAPVDLARRVRAGDELPGHLGDGRAVTGRVDRIDPRIEASSQTVRIVIALDNAAEEIMAGESVSFTLP